MKRQIFLSFIAALTGLSSTMNTFEAQSQTSTTKPPTLVFVVGSDWHTCGEWKNWSADIKLGYVLGRAEGIAQVMNFLGDDAHSYTKIKDAFFPSTGMKFGELTKAIDDFCSDYRNMKIPTVNAMKFVSGNITGFPSYDEKEMRFWRCVAAAGNDQSKISDCTNQP